MAACVCPNCGWQGLECGETECPMCNFVTAKGYEDMAQENKDFAESVVPVIREDEECQKESNQKAQS